MFFADNNVGFVVLRFPAFGNDSTEHCDATEFITTKSYVFLIRIHM